MLAMRITVHLLGRPHIEVDSDPSYRFRSQKSWGLLAYLSLPLAIKPVRAVRERTDGPALNGALAGTGALLGAFALLVSVGLLI